MNRSDTTGPDGQHRHWPGGPRWRTISAAAAAILIGTSLLLPAGRHQWALSLFRQPVRFTSLAFKYAWLLPSSATTRTRIPVFFTISNDEGKTVRYRYVLREIDPLGNSRTLGSASKSVAAGSTWTVAGSVRPSCNLSPCEVQVLLPGHPETLDFLVVLKAPPKSKQAKSKKSRHGQRK
jgi:hypothetical protein